MYDLQDCLYFRVFEHKNDCAIVLKNQTAQQNKYSNFRVRMQVENGKLFFFI